VHRSSTTFLAALLCAVGAASAYADVPPPAVAGPITGPGSPSIDSTTLDLAAYGYVEEEFFVSGTAMRYGSDVPLSSDGKWTALPRDRAAYTTRLLVRRPATRARFDGTVLVEWLNVSAGFDGTPDWTWPHTMLLRDGWAWVGVSAQYVGVSGGPPLNRGRALKEVSPVRYEPLHHPGDSFSYDIFSQAGAAVRASATTLLGGLRPKRVIAAGESQSAYRLVTYVDAVHPLARVYDGFLVHSRPGDTAPLSEPPQPAIAAPRVVAIRDDVDVPVLTFQTETDVVAIGFFAARQPDGPNLRTWEVAGTAHVDTYAMFDGRRDPGPAARGHSSAAGRSPSN
jgi:hypothetical protein